MVDWIVSAAVEKLNSILVDKVAMLVDIPDEITKLSSTFTSIQALLEDAESRRVKAGSVKIWLEKVKDLAYDVDDVLDEWMTEALKSKVADEGDGSSPSKKRKVSSIFSAPVTKYIIPLNLRLEIGRRIKEVRGRLDDIEKEKNQFNFITIDRGEGGRVDSEVRRGEIRDRETSSLLDPFIVGREEVKKRVVGLLVGGSSREVNEVPFVISIVGMGGLGKTTLAQLIYNDENVRGHFNMRMWVCVSEDFDVKRITKLIIESADESSCEDLSLALLQSRLSQKLQAKRFLLVLDDVWRHDSEKWDKLRLPFQAGAPGSRIIVTTRLEDVALAMGSAHTHKLAFLSNDDCWSVFKHIALKHRSKEERSEWKDIGKEIVNQCRGLPLAAKAIGSAMRLKRTRREWELVWKNKIWNSGNVLGGILPALLLSYHDLPPPLKQCFTYLSIFPKDWKIEKDKIVKLWVAQGFICSEGSEDMEEIGGLYFDDLLRRSLLQDAELDDDGNICRCKMHDLVHDLAQSVAGSDFSLVQIGNQASLVQIGKQASRVQMVQIGKQASLMQNGKQASLNFNNVRHSLFSSDETVNVADEEGYISATLYKAHKLRTLFLDSRISMVPRMSFHHWRRLRALNLTYTSIEKLSPTVGHLKHLRFLDLSHTNVEELPEEVCNCLNLQTLRLNYCQKLKKLPAGMKKMINLRHLEFAFCHSLNYLPQGIKRLTGLRTLTKFIVGSGNEGCKWGELNRLNHLQGSLQITGLENIRSTEEAREVKLNEKQNLHALTFKFGKPLDKEVLKILQPHTNLKKLEIWEYRGWKLPTWIENQAFSNLVSIKLLFCWPCKQLPCLGKLPSLKHLFIWGIYALRKVGVEFTGVDNNDGSGRVVSFPRLETLVFNNITYWEKWELRGGDGEVMPSLLQLEIVNCIRLKELPSNLPPLLQKLTLQMTRGVDPWRGSSPAFHPNLKHLIIRESRYMKSFPSRWLGQFKALKTLEIEYCNSLESLPDEELQQLTMLQELKIYGCPLLIWRYGDGGEDRDKISQIPKITFRV